jgi:hypothetical protein
VQLTKLIFGTCLELFVSHQLLHTSSNGLDMIDDQLVEIGVLFAAFNEEPITKALACDVRIRLGYVYE